MVNICWFSLNETCVLPLLSGFKLKDMLEEPHPSTHFSSFFTSPSVHPDSTHPSFAGNPPGRFSHRPTCRSTRCCNRSSRLVGSRVRRVRSTRPSDQMSSIPGRWVRHGTTASSCRRGGTPKSQKYGGPPDAGSRAAEWLRLGDYGCIEGCGLSNPLGSSCMPESMRFWTKSCGRDTCWNSQTLSN